MVLGGFGNDFIVTGDGNDEIDGGADDDVIISGLGTDVLSGGAGNDLISIDGGTKMITGGEGEDRLIINGYNSSNISFSESGGGLVISYGSNAATLTENDVEFLEVSNGIIDLNTLNFDSNGNATFNIDTQNLRLASVLQEKEANLNSEIETENKWEASHQLIDKISDYSYAEEIRTEAENTYYNGPEVYSIEKYFNTWKGPVQYYAYKLRYNDDIEGDDIVSVIASIDPGIDSSEFDYIYTNSNVYTSIFYHVLDEATNARELRIYTDIWVNGEVVYSHVEVSVNPDGYSEFEVIRSENIDAEDYEEVFDPTMFQNPVSLNAINRHFWRDQSRDETITMGEKILNTGSDLIVGTHIDETIKGNTGSDVLHGGAGDDIISAGSGNDWVYGGVGNDTIYGGQFEDVLHGGAGDDILYAGSGNDIVYGGAGNDILYEEAGNSPILYSDGDDILDGGDGDDILYAGRGSNILKGGAGDDTYNFFYADGESIIYEDETSDSYDTILLSVLYDFSKIGDNLVISSDNINIEFTITIKDYFDTSSDHQIESLLVGSAISKALPNLGINTYDYAGGIQFYEKNSNDFVDKTINLLNYSFQDIYTMEKVNSDVHITFDDENKLILSSQDIAHYIGSVVDQNGEVFNDFQQDYWYFSNHAVNNSSNLVNYLGGNDYLYGSNGAEYLYAWGGNDLLLGLGGDDTLDGALGDDTLDGGDGNDTLKGSSGADTFVIGKYANTTDTIQDYEHYNPNEKIDLSAFSNDYINYSQFSQNMVDESNQVRITLTGNQELVLEGVTAAQLSADNFIGIVANNNPIGYNDAFTINEDAVLTGNLLLDNGAGVDSDLDGDTLSVIGEIGKATEQGGTVDINNDGTFTYTPLANYFGTDSFTYTLTDGNGGTALTTTTISITGVNDLPEAQDDAFIGYIDEDVLGNFLSDNGAGNDIDHDGDILTLQAGTYATVQSGQVTITANGDFTYTPPTGFSGNDSFDYIVEDGNGNSDTATAIFTVKIYNDPPVLVNNGATTDEDTPLTITPAMLDLEDSDTLAINRKFTLQSSPSQGTISLNGVVLAIAAIFTQQDILDGLLSYAPNANENGSDNFTFSASDEETTLAISTFNIAINAVNDAPEAVADDIITDQNIALTFNPTDNDSDIDQDGLIVHSVTQGAIGAVIINQDGSITYTPHENMSGTDSFTYTVSDENGGTDTETVSLTINAVLNEITGTTGGETLIGTETHDQINDGNGNGHDILEGLGGNDLLIAYGGNDTLKGGEGDDTYRIEFDGVKTIYEAGTSSSFDTLTLNLYTSDPTFSISGNDLVIDSSYTSIFYHERIVIVQDYFDSSADHQIEFLQSTSLNSFALPDIDINNYSYSGGIKFYVDDPANPNQESINFTNHTLDDITQIERINDDLHITLDDDNQLILSEVLSWSSFYSGYISTLTDYTGKAFNPFGYDYWFIANQETGSTTAGYQNILSGNDYIKGSDFNDSLVGYDGQDVIYGGDGDDSLNGGAGHDVLYAGGGNDTLTGSTGSDTFVIGKYANTTDTIKDFDGSFTSERIDLSAFSNNYLNFSQLSQNFESLGFHHTKIQLSDTQSLIIEYVQPDELMANDFIGIVPNHAPVSQEDIFNMDENTILTGHLLSDNGNGVDSDLDGDPLWVIPVAGGVTEQGGNIDINNDGTFTYTPTADFYGPDTFSYTVYDWPDGGSNSASTTGTITITVNDVNFSPVAQDDSIVTDEDTSYIFDPLVNDSDIENDDLSIESVTQGVLGSVLVNQDGTITYSPYLNVNGSDSFTYTITDGRGNSHSASVSVTINAVIDTIEGSENNDVLIGTLDADILPVV